MRMLRVALVLIVLASFVAAMTAVSTAATVKPTVKPTVTMMPMKKPGKMIDLTQMKSNIGNVYKKMKAGGNVPGAGQGSSKYVKGEAGQILDNVGWKITQDKSKSSMSLNTPGMRSMPAPLMPGRISQLPQIGKSRAKMGKAPGEDLMIAMGL